MEIKLDQDPLLEQEINDVSQTTWKYIAVKYHKSLLIGYSIAAIWFFVSLYFLLFRQNSILMSALVFSLMAPVFLFAYISNKVRAAFMNQFAQANGYNYSPIGPIDTQTGYIFSRGHSRSVDDYITGKYLNCPLELFIFTYKEGFGKHEHTYWNTIFSLDFQDPVPHITLLRVDSPAGSSLGIKLQLEGNFNQKFNLYVQKGFEIEALQIFTPDFMAKVESWNLELEFIGTKLYVYAASALSKKSDLLNMYQIVKDLAARLDPLVEKMKSDVEFMSEIQK